MANGRYFCINFFTSYTNDIERVTDLKTISIHYLTGRFTLDLLGTLPGILTAELVWQVYYFKLLRYSQLDRFFRQIRFILEKIGRRFSTVNKNMVDNILVAIECLFAMLFLVHLLGCIWLRIGRSVNNGWVTRMDEFNSQNDDSMYPYYAAYYFITTTITTVGYGEILPHADLEIIFVMVLELIGLAAFSFILGTLTSIEVADSVRKIINSKRDGVKKFLDDTGNCMRDKTLPPEIYTNSIKNVEFTYNYGISYIFRLNGLNEHLKPRLRNQLSYKNLKNIYIKFIDLFANNELGFKSDDKFILSFLSNLE